VRSPSLVSLFLPQPSGGTPFRQRSLGLNRSPPPYRRLFLERCVSIRFTHFLTRRLFFALSRLPSQKVYPYPLLPDCCSPLSCRAPLATIGRIEIFPARAFPSLCTTVFSPSYDTARHMCFQVALLPPDPRSPAPPSFNRSFWSCFFLSPIPNITFREGTCDRVFKKQTCEDSFFFRERWPRPAPKVRIPTPVYRLHPSSPFHKESMPPSCESTSTTTSLFDMGGFSFL